MVTVRFYTLLRLLLKTREIRLDIDELPVSQVLIAAEIKLNKNFLTKLIEADGSLKTGTIILINGINIHHKDNLATVVKPGDILSLFPPGGGG